MADDKATPGSHEPQGNGLPEQDLVLLAAEVEYGSTLPAYEPGNVESYLAQLIEPSPIAQDALVGGDSVEIFPFELGEARAKPEAEVDGRSTKSKASSWLDLQKTPRSAFASPPLDDKASIPTPQFCGTKIAFRDRAIAMYTVARHAMLHVREERERKRRGQIRTSTQRRQYRIDKIRRDLLRCQLEDCRDREKGVTGMTLMSTNGLSDYSDSGPGTPLEEQLSEDGEWSERDIYKGLEHVRITPYQEVEDGTGTAESQRWSNATWSDVGG